MAYMPVKEEPLPEHELEEKMSARQKERQEGDEESSRDMESHPRCALLPSPELLDRSIRFPGSDRTDTLGDFKQVKNWAAKVQLLNTEFYKLFGLRQFQQDQLEQEQPEQEQSQQEQSQQEQSQQDQLEQEQPQQEQSQQDQLEQEELELEPFQEEQLEQEQSEQEQLEQEQHEQDQIEKDTFGSMIQLAFNTAFAAMRNTANPQLDELVFWYYAGHGLCKETAKTLLYSATPCLDRVGINHNNAADTFVNEDRKVKGGELLLHNVGFCDLYGLLEPWIVAIKSESINAKGQGPKTNKHFVIILDSCYSGIVAEELNNFIKTANKKDETLLRDNTVTIQAACGSDKCTFGGYFTPCFIHLNDPENEDLLNKLKGEWKNMTDEERREYRLIDLPSPMVVTTRPRGQSQDPTMEISVQGVKLTLFQDPDFFKYCSIRVFQEQQKNFLVQNARVLTRFSVNTFLGSSHFHILDYKLKTYVGMSDGRYARTPMALFLLKDPSNRDFAVCAHLHFARGRTTLLKRVNLVHHKKPPMGNTLYLEDDNGNKCKIYPLKRAEKMVDACRKYVMRKEPGSWEDVTKWDMTGNQLGVNNLFRKRERSSWEEKYLQYIKQFNLPEVTTGQTCLISSPGNAC